MANLWSKQVTTSFETVNFWIAKLIIVLCMSLASYHMYLSVNKNWNWTSNKDCVLNKEKLGITFFLPWISDGHDPSFQHYVEGASTARIDPPWRNNISRGWPFLPQTMAKVVKITSFPPYCTDYLAKIVKHHYKSREIAQQSLLIRKKWLLKNKKYEKNSLLHGFFSLLPS